MEKIVIINKRWALGVIFASLAGCALVTDSQADVANPPILVADAETEFVEELVNWVADYQEEDGIPGVAIALVHQDQILLLEGMGYRDLENELPVTPNTLFHIASTEKSITAMLAAIAVDQGLVDWDQPVVEFAPEFELSDPDATETVTLRHLLSMRSGISDEDLEIEELAAIDLFDHVAAIELLGEPGEVFDYSNVAVSLGGYLVALAAGGEPDTLGADYGALLTEWILEPIGMTDAQLLFSDAQATGDAALPYVLEGDEFVVAEREDFDHDPLSPSGGLKASITDMAKYMITQVQGGVTTGGELTSQRLRYRIVSAANLQETWEPRWGNYAMGWEEGEYQGVKVLRHEGFYDNFLSIIGLIPEYELGFVVLTNSGDAGGGLIEDISPKIVDLIQAIED